MYLLMTVVFGGTVSDLIGNVRRRYYQIETCAIHH